MDFGLFQTRGGTAPALTSVAYRRSTRSGRPNPTTTAAEDSYRTCEHLVDSGDDLKGLPKAPVPRNQRQDKPRQSNSGRAKGVPRVSTKKVVRGYHGARAGWGKRHGKNSGVGPTLSSRPASHQALSDLMDLNIALKMRKSNGGGGGGDTQPHPEVLSSNNTCRGQLHEGSGADSPSSPEQVFIPTNEQSGPPTSASISSGYQYSSLKEGYGVHASAYVPVKSDGSNHDECDDVGMPQDSTHPECLHNERQGYLSHRRANSMSNGDGHVLAVQSCVTIDSARNETLMISHAQSRSGESSPGIRVSPVASRGEQLKAATHERWVDAKRVQHYFRGCTRKRGSNAAPSGLGKGSYNRTRIVSEAEANSLDTANPTTTTPLDESSIQQSEKDQRMWSALKTSLLSEGLAPLDRLFTGFHNTDSEIKQEIVPGCMEDGGDRSSGDTTTMTFFDDQPGIEGTRNMEQLDLERSAMDRSMRPHRTASARLLATEPDPSSANRVKHPRNFSASATRSRSRQNESSISSVWVGAGGNLLCTGVRAELVPRGVEGSFDLETNDDKWYPAFDGEIDRGTTTSQRDGVQSLQRISDVGRFHWFTDEKGVANFLQRPPSRQKAAFPTHLADVVPYTAFQMELPVADKEAQQHIEVTRKTAIEQTRPPSRHKPPAQSLFLEVPEMRRQVPPMFSATLAGTESCGVLARGRHAAMNSADVEATTALDGLSSVFTLDQRHDNPDRDGFSVLQVQGPCPFRIEVTNSFVQPHPPPVSVSPETSTQSTTRTITNNEAKMYPPDPVSLLFGATAYETGRGGVGKQRAPINTTPSLPGSSLISPVQARGDTIGKGGASAKSSRMLCKGKSSAAIGSRTAGGSNTYSGPGEEGIMLGDVPSPPSRPTNNDRGSDGKGVLGRSEYAASKVGETSRQKADVVGEGEIVAVTTGPPGITVSDWSLQSCDDADDGAFIDGPASTLGDSAGTKHTLGTTLGQDFLSLFAPSSGRDNTSIVSTFDTF